MEYKKSLGSVADIGAESGTGKLSSNSELVCGIYFCTTALGKGMNSFFLYQGAG